jgi:Glycosyltransferase family 87
MSSYFEKRKVFVGLFLFAMAVSNISLFISVVPKLRNGYQDFTIFYTGARLLREGQRSLLYNLHTQFLMQQTFTDVPIRKGPLPFNHPPFEALFFVPFTTLGYWQAYLVWTALNVVMLVTILILLRKEFPLIAKFSPTMMAITALGFFPIAIGVMQGQDMVSFLLLFVLALRCLNRGKDAGFGIFLGMGLFRPQLVLPMIVLIAIRRWRILLGFVPVAILLGTLTVAIMGSRGPLDYARFASQLDETSAVAFKATAVPNLRGIFASLLDPMGLRWLAAVLIFASSAIVFLVALRRVHDRQDSIVFSACLASATAILVSFHSLVYDFTLLFPTMLFLLSRVFWEDGREVDGWLLLFLTLLFLTPLYAYLLLVIDGFVFYSIVLLWLYVRLLRTPRPAEVPV